MIAASGASRCTSYPSCCAPLTSRLACASSTSPRAQGSRPKQPLPCLARQATSLPPTSRPQGREGTCAPRQCKERIGCDRRWASVVIFGRKLRRGRVQSWIDVLPRSFRTPRVLNLGKRKIQFMNLSIAEHSNDSELAKSVLKVALVQPRRHHRRPAGFQSFHCDESRWSNASYPQNRAQAFRPLDRI